MVKPLLFLQILFERNYHDALQRKKGTRKVNRKEKGHVGTAASSKQHIFTYWGFGISIPLRHKIFNFMTKLY